MRPLWFEYSSLPDARHLINEPLSPECHINRHCFFLHNLVQSKPSMGHCPVPGSEFVQAHSIGVGVFHASGLCTANGSSCPPGR